MYDAAMASFFPPDYETLPRFTCADCGIYATVRGAVLVEMMRAQAQRCTIKGHSMTTENFDLNGEPGGIPGGRAVRAARRRR